MTGDSVHARNAAAADTQNLVAKCERARGDRLAQPDPDRNSVQTAVMVNRIEERPL